MDTEFKSVGNDSQQARWELLAELPYSDLLPVYEQVRKLQHIMFLRYDETADTEVTFAYRGYRFRIAKCEDRVEFFVNDAECPVELFLKPLAELISPLSRCEIVPTT